jgi:aminoglycoside phosphotransferase (APT) family kinase protein
MTRTASRRDIYYWKCDRPAAFRPGAAVAVEISRPELPAQLSSAIARQLGWDCPPAQFSPGNGQGNHLTFLLSHAGRDWFVRVEDGPEQDDYLEVESHLLREVALLGVPAPQVLFVDATRRDVPFAWHILERIPHPDLNLLLKQGRLDPALVGEQIGDAIARWQELPLTGFGPFDVEVLRARGACAGFHSSYAAYFFLQLDRHLDFLRRHEFLTAEFIAALRSEIDQHRALLDLEHGCLVHKDLALWNLLGTPEQVHAFIDWDDAVAGDPLDDVSLLACFHDGRLIANVLAGYARARPLPGNHVSRFWLHLLRNLIVKSVIRVGAGYFNRTDRFFLIGAGGTGASLREFTLQRLFTALHGLRTQADPTLLS